MSTGTVVIIPARYSSVRLPGKPLIMLADKPLIQWVYERARGIADIDRVVVATDDERIRQTVKSFGGEAELTPVDLANGSERAGFLARKLEADIVVNLQGDEPLISITAVAEAVKVLKEYPEIPVATLAVPLCSEQEWLNPAVVKVIVNSQMNAIYFSRAPIPYPRDDQFKPIPRLFRHLGVYVYRKPFLLEFITWPQGVLEKQEKLEQLRILENGYKIKVIKTEEFSPGVDTPEDVTLVEKMLKEKRIDW